MFNHYDSTAQSIDIIFLRFCFKKTISQPKIDIYGSIQPRDSLEFARAMLAGNTAVYEELLNGHDQRFDDLRQNPLVKRFIFDRVHRSKVSSSDAISFAKYFISECHSRTHLIDQSPFHVGNTADICIIDAKTGFRWLELDSKCR
jgi:hypothetical protein